MKTPFSQQQLVIILCCVCTTTASFATASNNATNTTTITPSTADIAQVLGWITAKNTNICDGYYYEPEIIKAYPKPKPISGEQTTITATKPAIFSQYGVSSVKGNVIITQPGRQVMADEVSFYRDSKTGEITTGALLGNVHFQEYGKLIVSKEAHWNFDDKKITLNNATYRLLTPAPLGQSINAWGNANKIVRDNSGNLILTKASYSTCPPTANTWKIWGNTVDLDKTSGRGSVTNALFYIKDIPIVYFPYFNFPLDKNRKSGFLYPTMGYTSDGLDFSLPYYFNLAPNYDATLTPRYISERGLLASGLLRYLTPENNGYINLNFMGHDSEFINLRNDAKTEYAPSHTLDLLENSEDYRGFFSMSNQANYNPHWSSSLDINYVTDNYYFQDFGGSAATIDQDQLLNQADLRYASENWHMLTRVQSFQTLDTVTQNADTEYQYRRVPQIDLQGDFPDSIFGLNFTLNNELVNFDFDHTTDPNTGEIMPVGTRVNIQPTASLPLTWAGGYITPAVQLQATQYGLRDYDESDITRTLPIATLDSGLFFNRAVTLFGGEHGYTQTLEPRIFYLFVPRVDQDDIPLFDTNLTTFNFDQLFQANRFSGLDRVGDANQISVALTSRFLDEYTAEEKMRMSIGQIYQFEKHKICIDNDCSSDPLAEDYISPLVAELQYDFTKNWAATVNVAWDVQDYTLNNEDVSIKYHDDMQHIFSVGYNFVRDGDEIDNEDSDNLNRINLSLSWPVFEHFNLLANWNYNISHAHPETYFYGAEYESCCWAIRLVQSETYIGTDENDNKTFDKAIYLQFLFKGLGNVGTSNANDLLTSQIPYYQDKFSSKP